MAAAFFMYISAMGFIYKISNQLSEFYVGSTKRNNINSRINEHRYLGKSKNTHLANSFRINGSKNHKAEIICEVEDSNRIELEHFIIQEFNPSLNMVRKHNNTAQGKIWVNNGDKEFQILPEFLSQYKNIKRGRLKFKK